VSCLPETRRYGWSERDSSQFYNQIAKLEKETFFYGSHDRRYWALDRCTAGGNT
jgi:hypothetical protein